MQRTVLYSLTLCLLFGIDIAFNDASITRDLWQAMTSAGTRTTHAVDATIGFMVGRAD